jgi:GH25 family lysozyme M1 (1,4-beta-N-acetylmuramidase)
MIRTELVIDDSHWQALIKGEELVSGGVRSVISKLSQDTYSDQMYRNHILETEAHGMIPQAYHWGDPIGTMQTELDYIVKLFPTSEAKFLWVDVEQWWSNWTKWSQANRGEIPWSSVPKFSASALSKFYSDLMHGLKDVGFEIGGYSAAWVLDEYIPGSAWLNDFPWWIAHYGRQPKVATTMSWETLKASWLPNYPLDIPIGMNPEKIVGHQFSGDVLLLPGVYSNSLGTVRSACDVSLFNKEFLEKISGTVLPLPPMDIKVAVNRLIKEHPEIFLSGEHV